MTYFIGFDVGGTKIAGAAFDEKGAELSQVVLPIPTDYESFIKTTGDITDQIEQKCGKKAQSFGMGLCGIFDQTTGYTKKVASLPFLQNKPLRADLSQALGRGIQFENDANCAALAEATEGQGKGYKSAFCLILGTGVGGGFVLNGSVISGANGLCGGFGHLPFPSREDLCLDMGPCGCGKTGCVEQFISGPALARLYKRQTGKEAEAKQIAALAEQKEAEAVQTLDTYFTRVAKAMAIVLQTLDPEVIVVSGGLSAVPGLYDEVPKRWGKYALCENPATKFVPASFGPMAGLRGAALLGQNAL